MITFLARFRLFLLVGTALLVTTSGSLLRGSEGTCEVLHLPTVKEEPDCHFLLKYFFKDELKDTKGLATVAQLIRQIPKELQFRTSSYLADWIVGTMIFEKPSREITQEPISDIKSFEFCSDDSHIILVGGENRLGKKMLHGRYDRPIPLETRAHVIPFSPERLQAVLSPTLYKTVAKYLSNNEEIRGCSIIDLAQSPATARLMYPRYFSDMNKTFIRMSTDCRWLGFVNNDAFIILALDNFQITEAHQIGFFENDLMADDGKAVRAPTLNYRKIKDFDYIEDFCFTPEGVPIILTNTMKRYKVELPKNAHSSAPARLVLINAHPTFRDKEFEHEPIGDDRKLVISAAMGEQGALFRINTGIKPLGESKAENLQALVWWDYQDNSCTQFMKEEHAYRFFSALGRDDSYWSIKNGLIATWLVKRSKFNPRYNAAPPAYEDEIIQAPPNDKIVVFNTTTKEVVTFFPKSRYPKDVSLSQDSKFLCILFANEWEIYSVPSRSCIAYMQLDIPGRGGDGACRFNNGGTTLATLRHDQTLHLWNVALLKELLPLYEVKLTLLQSLFILFLRDLKRQDLTLNEALPLLAKTYGISEESIRASLNNTYRSFDGALKVYVHLIARTACSSEEPL